MINLTVTANGNLIFTATENTISLYDHIDKKTNSMKNCLPNFDEVLHMAKEIGDYYVRNLKNKVEIKFGKELIFAWNPETYQGYAWIEE